jgi:type IV pilus assembly protein PilA
VVIAILGILALIAIPRFAGFTNRAKIQTDEQQVAVVVNTAKVLLAANDLAVSGTTTNNTVTLSKATSPYIAVGSGLTKATNSKNPATTNLQLFTNMIEVKALQFYDTIVITIAADGSWSATYTPTP